MKKIITILTLILTNTLFAQLEPGNYSYRNSDAQIKFAITEDGQMKDCTIKGTNDISLISLRQYKAAGTGEFVKIVSDPLKPSPFTGYYSVAGEMPTYEIKNKEQSRNHIDSHRSQIEIHTIHKRITKNIDFFRYTKKTFISLFY